MGTPEFAVASLEACLKSNHKVVAVITAPDKPKGRGQKLAYSPVKECAMSHGIQVLQPTNLKSPTFLDELQAINANLQVVVAFRMLPEVVWSMPEYGTFNLHASLLPQYRGAAPINWAVINGEKETGVTTFFIQHEIDTGNIILQDTEPIYEDDTAGTLYDRLMMKGADLVKETLNLIAENEFQLKKQSEEQGLKHAPKIFKEDCEIQWQQSCDSVRNFIRGMAPYPAAYTQLGDMKCKIFAVKKADETTNLPVGQFITDNKSWIRVQAADGLVEILELQPDGKKRMPTEDFLRGNKL